MNEITITITVRLPDGVVPDVQYGTGAGGQYANAGTEPPHLLEAPFYDRDEAVHAQSTLPAAAAPHCQFHGEMHRYPAGVSKKPGGGPYNASWRCSANGCTTAPLWDRDGAA